MRPTSALLPRLLSLIAQFVTFCGFVVIVAGLAKIQKKTNALGGNLPSSTVSEYDTTFAYAGVTPYSGSHGFQFSFIWFIIFFQLFVLLLTLALTFVPALLAIGRPAALALLASVMTLTILVVNNLTYFHRSPVAQSVYGKRDINVTYAGALLVVIGNALTILALGMWAYERTAGATTHVATSATPHYAAQANQAKREVEAGGYPSTNV